MSEPFIAEIQLMSYPFYPRGWSGCDGSVIQISSNQALFALLGTTYGGNGTTNFNLPDLRGRTPIHWGSTAWGAFYNVGEKGGAESVTLTTRELPTHTHQVVASGEAADQLSPEGNVLAAPGAPYAPYATSVEAVSLVGTEAGGGSQAHTNMQPYLVLRFAIAMQGLWPSRN